MHSSAWTRVLGLTVGLTLLAGCSGAPASNNNSAPAGSTGAAAPAASKPLTKVTLMLNWYPYGEHAAFYYGLKKGFFKDEGIDLTIQPGSGSSPTVTAVGAKQVDFGWADSTNLINGIAQGIPVKSIGAFLQTTPSSIEFFADKGIKSPADLKGKTIGATAGDAPFQALPAFLGANNLTMNDVTIVNVSAAGKLAALIDGKVDTIIGFAHDQAPTIENQSGKKTAVLRYSDYGVNYLSNGLLANVDTLKSKPDLVKAFLRATVKSWQEAAKNPQEAVDIMSQMAEKAPPKEVMINQFNMTLQLLHTKNTQGKLPGVNDAADWQATIDMMTKYTGLKNAGKPSDYWDGSFAPNN